MRDIFMRNMKGTLHLQILDSVTREVINEFIHRNLIVDAGYAATAQSLAGVAGAAITYVQVGTSTTQHAPSDTAITEPVQIPIISVEYPDFAARFNFQIDANTANGMSIAEWGLITRDGRLFSRIVRDEIIAKTDAIEILGAWTINLQE